MVRASTKGKQGEQMYFLSFLLHINLDWAYNILRKSVQLMASMEYF